MAGASGTTRSGVLLPHPPSLSGSRHSYAPTEISRHSSWTVPTRRKIEARLPTVGFYEWFTSGAKGHKRNVGEQRLHLSSGAAPARTEAEAARPHKSTHSALVSLDVHSEWRHPSKHGGYVPQAALHVKRKCEQVNKIEKGERPEGQSSGRGEIRRDGM